MHIIKFFILLVFSVFLSTPCFAIDTDLENCLKFAEVRQKVQEIEHENSEEKWTDLRSDETLNVEKFTKIINALVAGRCNNYMQGLLAFNQYLLTLDKKSTLQELSLNKIKRDYLFCPPKNKKISPYQMVLITRKYMKENPQELHKESAYIIITALKKEFPCE